MTLFSCLVGSEILKNRNRYFLRFLPVSHLISHLQKADSGLRRNTKTQLSAFI